MIRRRFGSVVVLVSCVALMGTVFGAEGSDRELVSNRLVGPPSQSGPFIADGIEVADPPIATKAPLQANLLVNNDFENTSAGTTQLNPSNSEFNAFMTSVTAFGIREGIDIQTFGSGFGVAPQSGSWKVSPASDAGGDTEAFSFELTSPLVAGSSYDLSFYFERLASGVFDGGVVEVGVSSSATAFGTLVYTSIPAVDGWTLASTTFSSPISASHLTVRLTNATSSWVGLDNFSLSATIPVALQSFSVE